MIIKSSDKVPSKDNAVKTFFKTVQNYVLKTASKIFVES
jgi:hypothetical protein